MTDTAYLYEYFLTHSEKENDEQEIEEEEAGTDSAE